MNLTFSPSLEEMALANIAITLWSKDDIRHLFSKSTLDRLNDSWEEIEKAVIEKSLKLWLPETLKQKLLDFILRVGLQIIAWIDFHYCDYGFVTELPAMFVWTSGGTINNIKTAKLLVMSGTLDCDACFALACMYCLEDEIKYCWNVFDLSLRTSKLNCLNFVSYWSDYMDKLNGLKLKMKRDSSNSNPYPCLILESVRTGNEAATRYFFQKVNKKEGDFVMLFAKVVASKLYSLKKRLSLERYSGVMLFLLSEMNAKQQAEMFTCHAYALLMCLLVWPWQSLFLEMVKDKWNFLSKDDFNRLLHHIASMMTDRNLHKLFEEFWQQSPETYKRFVTVEGHIRQLFLYLYHNGDEKIVKLILKYTSIIDRRRLLFSEGSEKILVCLLSAEKWNSIEFLIQECSESYEDLIIFRGLMKRYVTELQDKSIKEYQWNKFFQLLNGCIFRCNKKNKQKTMIHHTSKKRLYKCIEE